MLSAQRNDLLGLFTRHPVAANLLMTLMILAGFWALTRLNTQFFPNFELDFVTVRVAWTGSTAEDVETSITNPLERELRNLDGVRKITSTSANGVASVTLEYDEGTDMGTALDEVKQRVDQVRNLPATAEEPEVSRVVRYEPIARLMLYGDRDLDELRHLARRFERELLDRGIAKVSLSGLPEEEMAVQIPQATLQELGLSLPNVADRLRGLSQDLPAGTVGRNDVAQQLRSLEQQRDAAGFATLPLQAGKDGRLLRLGDVATIERRPRQGQMTLSFHNKPAIELRLERTENADSLESARILAEWEKDTLPQLPPGVEVQVFDESWRLIEDRLMLLIKNGIGGLALVVAILFLFLNGRVAFWVAIGIPTAFMATLLILYLTGGSINMISLFALIMALGIIVDDAIVVGEDTLAQHQRGAAAEEAAESGARRMLAPVMASSLTTVAAFLPLMLVGGVIGNIMMAIPVVMVCVLLASVVESFLVLPGHLHHSLRNQRSLTPGPLRQRLDRGFNHFRDGIFRPTVERAVRYRWTTLAAALATLILSAGLIAGGRMNFTFFPTPESTTLYASASFVAGTPPERVHAFLDHMQATLNATSADFGGNLIVAAQTRYGESQIAGGRGGGTSGDQQGSMIIELTQPDTRAVRMNEFIKHWRAKIQRPPGLETLLVFSRSGGPPGRDVDIQLTGDSTAKLKAAAQELAQSLSVLPGVSAIEDDMPYGSAQLIYRMTPLGEALGLTVEEVGRQLRAAYDGALVQIFQDGEDEVEVRVVLPDSERHRLTSLDSFNVILPGGHAAPLGNVVELRPRQGFEVLRHAQGRLAVQVSADVDSAVNNAGKILAGLEQSILPELRARYGIDYSFEGRSADQAETVSDMRRGAVLGLALIYIILAWVFGSYGWPLVVMMAIPFGIIGGIVGHWLLGIDLTILSLFGFFGLAGIVINDSIILVTFYKQLRADGLPIQEALVEAACQRLRAVLLTSLTTIAGLLPLLFETSLQAQFLIPMAVSISFGLGFATLLVLYFVPATLSVYESALARWRGHDGEPARSGQREASAIDAPPDWLTKTETAVPPPERVKMN
ncbi:MAG: efflux RND transporter permease subunit [Gammaproteobacteria bacterium]|nr:efflux RND transporter permease subunit [Gammaproteobacteria bacterium]MCP5424064.1 efflux RND transporter permease subunit [Gammaproteobacteria bacterium]